MGIIGHDRVLVSLAAPHFINGKIKETKKLSINIVDEGILPRADYVGSVSGNKPGEAGSNLTENYVGANFANYDYFVILSHFKGHAMAGLKSQKERKDNQYAKRITGINKCPERGDHKRLRRAL